ncbi:hypothetical protein GLOTRDRAFT_130625 [Gloeophyllum trabeum ATCC 11539]|uniref:CS domain-containing protein n=1 Tax=Gloeophyllum trabeum (strain ATCC 11539 / FP-39264 / Madison 617) TaxID=670483 RepID=S7Q3Z1_GLOTA|nr:uncharacterized protein GLOTRDRAFT_130625 [Gloeophyllum trabeum ATCC 11539]EPQ54247.1 hypothetical protein GLOTRDRAFT_130625 [Gloeophyllum trabeum ATCC 11539]
MDINPNAYSWHQSHDQATVLIVVPYEITDDDILFIVDGHHLAAGVHGHAPMVKGHLYGQIDTTSSTWQLEPRPSASSRRERTISTVSTASTQSSYAVISDPEYSSSAVTGAESAQSSDIEDVSGFSSLSSPMYPSSEDHRAFSSPPGRRTRLDSPAPRSPQLRPSMSVTSSMSSLESLHTSRSGRLLTLHLEKVESALWPCLISGPAPEGFARHALGPLPLDRDIELKYNMDPTSLMLVGSELLDLRDNKEEAFEYFQRAWVLGRLPTAALRLVTQYIPAQPGIPAADLDVSDSHGTLGYYSRRLGGPTGLSEVYLAAGFLHLEGTASRLLSSPWSPLSSIRLSSEGILSHHGASDTEAWHRDREAAEAYFALAKALDPTLDVPSIWRDTAESPSRACPNSAVELTSIDIALAEAPGGTLDSVSEGSALRRRSRRGTIMPAAEAAARANDDSTWYLYVPGLVGAGTALLLVGVIGALSFSWKKNQSS